MSNVVSLVHTESFSDEGIRRAAFQAIDLIGFQVSSVRHVIIKPNLRWYWDYSTGETTDPRVISTIIDYVRGRWGNDVDIKIVESDASAMRTKHAFKILGYERLAREKSVELFNLSEDEVCEKEVSVKGRKFTLPLPSSIFKSDLFINAPKLKVGPYASGQCLHMTCALKNLFGCISTPRKVKFHSHLQEVIMAVNKLIKPNLTIVDGVIALGRHPIKLGLIIVGLDNLAVEFVAARIMGYNPKRIPLIQSAFKEGIGDIKNIREICQFTNDINHFFPKRNRFLWGISWKTQFSLLHLYTKFSGDAIPTVLESV